MYWVSFLSLSPTPPPFDNVISSTRHSGQFVFNSHCPSADAPACILPITFVDKKVDKKRTSFTPLNEQDTIIQSDYDPELYDGVPVSVQLMGKRYQEERLLAVAKKIDQLVKAQKEDS